MNANRVVIDAILNAKRVIPYQWTSVMESMIPRDGQRDTCVYGVSTVDNLQTKLLQAHWVPCEHHDLAMDCRGYLSKDIYGRVNTVSLRTLPEDHPVKLHDGMRCNRVVAHVKGVESSSAYHTTLVVGKLYEAEVALRIHIGDVVTLSSVEANDRHGDVITVKEALEMGLEIARIV